MTLLAISGLPAIVAALLWLINLWRDPASSAMGRHRIIVLLLIYGICLIPANLFFLFAGLEFGFVTWGGPDNFVIVFGFLSAVIAIIIGAFLALADVILLKSAPSTFIPKGDQ